MTYSQWRVVLNNLPGHRAPTFDDVKHSGICREARHLFIDLRTTSGLTDALTTAQMPLRGYHKSPNEPMDQRLLSESGANAS